MEEKLPVIFSVHRPRKEKMEHVQTMVVMQCHIYNPNDYEEVYHEEFDMNDYATIGGLLDDLRSQYNLNQEDGDEFKPGYLIEIVGDRNVIYRCNSLWGPSNQYCKAPPRWEKLNLEIEAENRRLNGIA